MVMKVGGGFDGMGVARRGRGGNRWCAGMSLVCVGGRACVCVCQCVCVCVCASVCACVCE